MKFGGTSVANFEAITRAIFIVGGRLDKKPVVVVSALSKVTDLLYRISDAAAARNSSEARALMSELRTRHVNLASDLLEQSPALKENAVARVNSICDSPVVQPRVSFKESGKPCIPIFIWKAL